METEAALPRADLVPGITGLVLTKNGERLGEQCFSSLSFCDAVLAVDSGSTDQTRAIAERHGAVFIFHPWEGFASQFSYAQTLVRTRWFFILDQDELCPPELAERIREVVTAADLFADTPADAPVAFTVRRRSWYFDRFLRHGGWYPDIIPRIFRTGFVEFSQKAHIEYHALGRREDITGSGAEIIHYPYSGFSHQLEKLNVYAEQGAAAMRAAGKTGGILRGIAHGFGRFLRIYIWKRGFLDGRAGFLAAAHGAIYAFLKYARTLEASWGAPFDGKREKD